MRLSRTLAAVVLATALLATSPNDARACAAGGGPVVGYAVGSGFTLGWELAGTACLPIAHFVLGGSYRLTPGDGPTMHHYAAWEPWLIVGGTLGVSLDDRAHAALAIGGWEAVPVLVENIRRQEEHEAVPAWMVTFAIGIRSLGAGLEIYVAPKLQWVERHDFFT